MKVGQMRKNRLIAIDPSINTMGLSVWDIGEKKLLAWGLVKPGKACRENPYDKSYDILCQVKQWRTQYAVNRFIVEIPDYWYAAGFEARESRSIEKLMFVCGCLYSLKGELDEFKFVKPREWKGQMPKQVVKNRLREKFLSQVDLEEINENIMDAIAIGHFYVYGGV